MKSIGYEYLKVMCNENVTSYKVNLPPPTTHSHNLAVATLIRTAESLWLVSGHPQTVDNSKQFTTKVSKDPECQSWLQ